VLLMPWFVLSFTVTCGMLASPLLWSCRTLTASQWYGQFCCCDSTILGPTSSGLDPCSLFEPPVTVHDCTCIIQLALPSALTGAQHTMGEEAWLLAFIYLCRGCWTHWVVKLLMRWKGY